MFELRLEDPAKRFLKKIDRENQKIIIKKIKKLKNNPELGKPLVGKLTGIWSLKIGKYRALYQIRKNELLILILKIGHRKNIYGR